jgi:hypothetical protein
VVVMELPSPPATAAPAGAPLPTTEPRRRARPWRRRSRGAGFLPKGLLFAALIADPRWLHFSAMYQRLQGDARLRNAAIAT